MKPPRNMSAKEYARWLNEDCFLPYEEACRMAGYNPHDEHQREAMWFCVAIFSVALVIIALSYMPEMAK